MKSGVPPEKTPEASSPKSSKPGESPSGGRTLRRQSAASTRRRPAERSAQRPAERSRNADVARLAAFDAISRVRTEDAYANLVLPELLRSRKIGPRDAGFATELTYGTLRMSGLYDAILGQCVDRPLDQLDPGLLDALRLGTQQILAMRVPPHAAVSETVALVRQRVGAGPAALANAVLRKVTAHDQPAWLLRVASSDDETAALATTHSHPEWIVRAFRAALATSSAELPALLAANNSAPEVCLVARPGLCTPEELHLAGAGPGRWSPWAARWSGDPGTLAAVREGRAGVQDEGSQLVAAALAAAPLRGPDQRWLDLCAGPGGKAALLGALAAQRGAELTAIEVLEHRATLVRKSVQQLPVTVRCADGRAVGAAEPESYDRVLVDVPCTGLGALRRRPEARWRRTPADLGGLGPLQRDLLRSALAAVRPGGVVAYVTCSPHPAETELVVRDALRGRTDFERVDAAALVPVPHAAVPGSLAVQLWPHRHGTDAMFLALLRRTG